MHLYRLSEAATLLVVGLSATIVPPRDNERICRYCPPPILSSLEMFERWQGPFPKAWSLYAPENKIAPGWDAPGCVGATFDQSRGYGSIVAAMGAWNFVKYETTGCDPAPRAGIPCNTCTDALSNFGLATSPSQTTDQSLALDLVNRVTLGHNDAAFWTSLGGSMAISVTAVWLGSDFCDPSVGIEIRDADIALNTNAWRFVEWPGTIPGQYNLMPDPTSG